MTSHPDEIHFEDTITGMKQFQQAVSIWSSVRLETAPAYSERQAAVIQPHADDACLSASGVLRVLRPTGTIFTTHPPAANSEHSAVRRSEDEQFAAATGMRLHYVGLVDGECQTDDATNRDARRISEAIRSKISSRSKFSILAPMGISRHRDHHAAHRAAKELQGVAFWEDTAFWGIYAQSIDDRVLTSCTSELSHYALVAVGIDSVIQEKAAMLAFYGSQSTEIWRPLRFARTASLEIDAKSHYVERFFVENKFVQEWASYWSLKLAELGTTRYGLHTLRTFEAIAI
jgi:LmbE family N-acetylglucosaminyl deacetylase